MTPDSEDSPLARWRAETPLVNQGRVHLNNAGSSPMPRPVTERLRAHLTLEEELGGYESAALAAPDIEDTYRALAELLGTEPRHLAVVENATVAYAQALSAFDFDRGDVLLLSRNDYASNQLMFLALRERRGVEIVRAEDLPEGGVDPESVRRLVRERRPKLVSVTHVPTSSGLIQPVAAVGEICRELEIPYLVDGCQAVGQLVVDVAEIGCDFYCGTARKFLRGPRGIGFLYVSDRILEAGRYPLYLDMHGGRWLDSDRFAPIEGARRFENFEFAYALHLGLGEAARYLLAAGVERTSRRARELAALFRQQIAGRQGLRCLDHGTELGAIVAVEVSGLRAADLVLELRGRRIHTSAIDRSSAVLDMDEKGAASALRVSPHYYNTEAEIHQLVAALDSLVRRQQGGASTQ